MSGHLDAEPLPPNWIASVVPSALGTRSGMECERCRPSRADKPSLAFPVPPNRARMPGRGADEKTPDPAERSRGKSKDG